MDTATIITAAPNATNADLPHHRMPVILGEETWGTWLDPEPPCPSHRNTCDLGRMNGWTFGRVAPRPSRSRIDIGVWGATEQKAETSPGQ